MVGMSGGVDSSVAALLLKQQNKHICGTFMRNWEADNDDPHCQASIDLTDAKSICDILAINLQIVNFADDYWQRVFQHFLDEYAAGRTPNPDIWCNQEIKFQAFLNYALEQGANKIATGHYARMRERAGNYQLLQALDTNKDQTYFLYRLNQYQLQHSIFPLGELTKTEVRQLAQQAGLPNHHKKDSTGICFIGERKFNHFLREYLLAKPGAIVTVDGTTIGQHQGLMYYTIGQRQGIGIGGRQHAAEQPWYVLDKDIANNRLLVGQGHDHPLLFKSTLIFNNASWIAGRPPQLPMQCQAKIRYRQTKQLCIIKEINQQQFLAEFTSPQRAITPGQSIVLYDDDVCLGGGIIQ